MTEGIEVSFGFLLAPIQLLDMVGPMDVLTNSSTNFVKLFAEAMPQADDGSPRRPGKEELISKSLNISWHHVGPTMDPVSTSGGMRVNPTCTFENCPKLDYLIIGGPLPDYAIVPGQMPESMKEFLRQRSEECEKIFTNCTGALILASAGVLDGQHATVNHAFVGRASEAFPNVKWSKDKNWVVSDDGRFWTASGAISGTDMVAHWVKEKCGEDILGLCTQALEYQPRDVDGKFLSYVNGRGELISA